MAYGTEILNSKSTNTGKDITVGKVTIFSDALPTNETPVQENLFTDGSEYALINGTPYTGEYHIHPDKGPMVGAKHITETHASLFPLEDGNSSSTGGINFVKKIYSKTTLNSKINNSFSELTKPPVSIDIPRFFKTYSEIFYDLPKEGINSHTSLIKESTDFVRNYIDPKDSIIEGLEQQIIDLERQLTNPEEIQEHPVFKNGTLIRSALANADYYYMDKGYARYVNWNGDMVRAILLSYTGTQDTDLVPVVTDLMLANIPRGFPNLSEDNFGEEFDPTVNQSSGTIQYLSWIYDNNGDPDIDPNNYDTRDSYIEALEADIEEKQLLVLKLNKQIRDEYNPQILTLKNLDPVYYSVNYGSEENNTSDTIEDIGSNNNRSY